MRLRERQPDMNYPTLIAIFPSLRPLLTTLPRRLAVEFQVLSITRPLLGSAGIRDERHWKVAYW
jgi:hypothetical protein